MENEITDKQNLSEKLKNFIIKKKKILLTIISIVIILLIAFFSYKYFETKKNEKISEKYILAGIYLSNEENEKSKLILKEIIKSKNKFYSPLSLNIIIDNNLEENEDEILKLFEMIEKINLKKEEKNLVKLKKALYLQKVSKEELSKKLLNEIILDNSIWKNSALNILER